jgi:TPR repeat protein
MGILGKAGLAGVVLLGGVLSGGVSAVEYSGVDLADKQLCLVAAEGTYKGSSSFIWDPKFKAYRNEAVKRGLTPEKCGLYFSVVQGRETSSPATVAKVVQSAPMTECDRLAASPGDPKKLGAGVEGDKVKGLLAIFACEAAVKAYPDEERLWFQMGRAFHINDYYILSIPWYRKAAVRGYSAAQNNLGVMYANGYGVTKDYKEAVKWFRKAAEQGNPGAQNYLGLMYDNGEGVTKDLKEAVKWYRKAAEQGYASAQFILGVAHDYGKGVTKDLKEAVKWYRKAADQKYASAQYNLGRMYAEGEAVAKDHDEAVKWYRKAAEQGNAGGQLSLGYVYLRGEGVTKDDQEAVKWVRKAAEQGNGNAQAGLGGAYVYGQGVAKDLDEAVKWYRKAAVQGNAWGQYGLGNAYLRGEGVTKDLKEAVKWYRKAAVQGNAKAQYGLGYAYSWGLGVVKDNVQALKWMYLSSDQGIGVATRDNQVKMMTQDQIAEARHLANNWKARSAPDAAPESPRKAVAITKTGNDLLEYCAPSAKYVGTANEELFLDLTAFNCFGYIIDVLNSEYLRRNKDFCYPPGIKGGDIAAVVKNYITIHKEMRQEPAPKLIIQAVEKAWPC